MREVDVLMVRVVFKLLGIWSTWKFFDFKALGTSAPKLFLVTCCCCLHTTGRRYQRANMNSIHDFMHRISDIYIYIYTYIWLYMYICIPIILYVITIQYSSLHINNSRSLVVRRFARRQNRCKVMPEGEGSTVTLVVYLSHGHDWMILLEIPPLSNWNLHYHHC